MSTLDFLPLLKAPESWPTWLVGAIAMLALAALDVAGALAAKQWAATSHVVPLLLGVAAFLDPVLGVRVGAAVRRARPRDDGLDRRPPGRPAAHRPVPLRRAAGAGKWVAAVVILLAQGYLLLGPSGVADETAVVASSNVTVETRDAA